MSKRKISLKYIILIKIVIIGLFTAGFFYSQDEYSNTIPLLAVNELSNGDIVGGSKIDLTLKIKPGSGEIFTDLNSIKEIDTQISIFNSQKVACNLFELDCENYDFYYEFHGDSFILKGPSASSAIAILVATTMQNQKLDPTITMTGSLNSGGIIGNVGGVEEKIETATQEGLQNILIPVFSTYDRNKNYSIKVTPVIDIIDTYNQITGSNYNLKQDKLDKENYNRLMRDLSIQMCNRNDILYYEINQSTTKINSSNNNTNQIIQQYLNQRESSLNSSLIANNNNNYYSSASFCYNANINTRIAIEVQKNYSLEEIKENLKELEEEINLKKIILNSEEYKVNNVKTLNDFYVHILLIDRIQEASNFIDEAKDEETFEQMIGLENKTKENLTQEEINSIINQKTLGFSYAKERLFSVELWENFMTNQGPEINLDKSNIENTCNLITNQIEIKNQILIEYEIEEIFEEGIEEQKKYSIQNPELCIYNGLKLDGRINTVLNSAGITNNQTKEFTQEIINIAENRLSYNTKNHFPLLPYIYYEYSKELIEIEDTQSALLYANYALSYQEINMFLKNTPNIKTPSFKYLLNQVYQNPIFILAVLVLIGFSGIQVGNRMKKININTNSKPAKLEKKNKKAQEKIDEIVNKQNITEEEEKEDKHQDKSNLKEEKEKITTNDKK